MMEHLLLAAGSGGPVWGLPPQAWHAINLLIFGAIIVWAMRKVLVPAIRERSKTMRKEIEEAQALRAEMTEKFQDYEQRLSTIDSEMEAMVNEARTEAEAERERIVEEARQTAERMKSDARQIADQEVARARRELLQETLVLARDAAAEAIEKHVTADDQKRLAEEFLDKVGETSA